MSIGSPSAWGEWTRTCSLEEQPSPTRIGNDFLIPITEPDPPFLHRGRPYDSLLGQRRDHQEFICQAKIVQIEIERNAELYAQVIPGAGGFGIHHTGEPRQWAKGLRQILTNA